MYAYLSNDDELGRILGEVTDKSLEIAATTTEFGMMPDSIVRFPTSERQAPAALAEVTEGEYGALQAGWSSCQELTLVYNNKENNWSYDLYFYFYCIFFFLLATRVYFVIKLA